MLLFHEGRLLACGAPEEVFTRKELLDTASLEEPCVLSMYQALREKGLLPDLQNCPRTLNDLKEYLRYV